MVFFSFSGIIIVSGTKVEEKEEEGKRGRKEEKNYWSVGIKQSRNTPEMRGRERGGIVEGRVAQDSSRDTVRKKTQLLLFITLIYQEEKRVRIMPFKGLARVKRFQSQTKTARSQKALLSTATKKRRGQNKKREND